MCKNSIIIAFITLSASACTRDPEPIIQQKVADNVATARTKKTRACREELLSLAEKTVDSLLLEEAIVSSLDSINRLKPVKPARPKPIPALDSAEVKPIFR